MNESSPPVFPDRVYVEQAEYLAEHTDLTAKEAEAYLRRSHTPDDRFDDDYVSQRSLAAKMDITETTFSNHLSNAREKLDSDDATRNAYTTMLATTDFGGSNGHSRRVIGARATLNSFVLITKTEFFDQQTYIFPAKYKAHFIYRERAPEIDNDPLALPDGVGTYDKHTVFTINSSDPDHFVKSVDAYMQALDTLDAMDRVSALSLLDDLEDFDASDRKAAAAVEECADELDAQ